jgi:hypothetical protein
MPSSFTFCRNSTARLFVKQVEKKNVIFASLHFQCFFLYHVQWQESSRYIRKIVVTNAIEHCSDASNVEMLSSLPMSHAWPLVITATLLKNCKHLLKVPCLPQCSLPSQQFPDHAHSMSVLPNKGLEFAYWTSVAQPEVGGCHKSKRQNREECGVAPRETSKTIPSMSWQHRQ